MLDTISRDELKAKLDSGEAFTLVETLAEVAYQHAHLPGAINLPPDRVRELASRLLPDKGAEIVATALALRDTPPRTSPVNWRRLGTRRLKITQAASRTGSRRGYLQRANTNTEADEGVPGRVPGTPSSCG
jgi:rhodanese-related sulfurtransferase